MDITETTEGTGDAQQDCATAPTSGLDAGPSEVVGAIAAPETESPLERPASRRSGPCYGVIVP